MRRTKDAVQYLLRALWNDLKAESSVPKESATYEESFSFPELTEDLLVS